MAWLHEVDRLEAALTQWAEANVPEWYLTTHGIHEPLVPTWELALGYLYQSKD